VSKRHDPEFDPEDAKVIFNQMTYAVFDGIEFRPCMSIMKAMYTADLIAETRSRKRKLIFAGAGYVSAPIGLPIE
jgi:hypothetical protein